MIQLPTLSIRQPWAIAILQYGKDVENRQWKFGKKYRGPILLHASKTLTNNEYLEGLAAMPAGTAIGSFPHFEMVPRGGIVGACYLQDILDPIERDEGWAMSGCRRLMLRQPVSLPFRQLPGALGFFKTTLTPAEHYSLTSAGLLQ